LAVTFTWLMGLMGFARSGIRQYWHVWQVMQDTSKYAATPALGYASKMISLCVLIFLSLVAFVFWLGGLAEKSTFVASGEARREPGMWATNAKIIGIVLGTLALYTLIANKIPQVQSEVPQALTLGGQRHAGATRRRGGEGLHRNRRLHHLPRAGGAGAEPPHR